jgi:hypothetical protein
MFLLKRAGIDFLREKSEALEMGIGSLYGKHNFRRTKIGYEQDSYNERSGY